jgi:hypothetical protein
MSGSQSAKPGNAARSAIITVIAARRQRTHHDVRHRAPRRAPLHHIKIEPDRRRDQRGFDKIIITMPYQTGSKASENISGAMIGIVVIIIDSVSMKQPRMM